MIGQRGGPGPAQRGALATGLRTLELLVSAHRPLGVTDVAEDLGIDKANAHRTLAALVRLGYVEQDPSTRRYGATVRVVELARSVLDSKDLTVVAAPHLKSLWAASGENTHLAVLAGDHVVYVSTLNGMTLLSANAAIGQSGPLHCTATGKALIANLPRGTVEGLLRGLDFEAFTPRTMTTREGLQKELAQVRVTGYAVDDREYHPGVRCVAAPIFGIGGVIASLGISAPADRLDADRLRILAPIVVDTAARVSRELGGPATKVACVSEPRTGGQVIADHLAANGVPYVVGIPGHGCLPMVDAFVGRDRPTFLQVRHEQSAAHIADAYFRVVRKPLAVMTSIGPGAVNTAVGIATAYVDSSTMLVFTGDVHTYMFGRGVLQEVDRKAWADLTTLFEPITKRLWQVTRVDQLARILPQAHALAVGGRPGPVLISVPMDVQADAADVPAARQVDLPRPPAPAAEAVTRIRAALADARRPVLLAGGGVVQSGASDRFRAIAEHLGMPVVATYQAKGVLPEDHPLYGRYPGSKGTDTGNALCREADVILAIGCRFADEATSSYVPGVTFSIPPTRLYQVDIDEYEIGKNYPVELGVVADAAAFCEALWAEIRDEPPDRMRRDDWERHVAELVVPWNARLAPGRNDRSLPLRISAVLDIVHDAVPADTIVLTGAGHSQAQFLQEYTVGDASQVISPNGFSTMGFTVPGAIGAKLAAPHRPVLGFAGDGDFLMTVQELAMAAQYGLDVTYVVVDNAGWQSIRDLQLDVYGEEHGFAAEFRTPGGVQVTPDLVTVARGFGVESTGATDELALRAALGRALASGGPTVIVVPVRREYPESAGPVSGWWDVPVPASLPERRGTYEREVAAVRRDAVKRG